MLALFSYCTDVYQLKRPMNLYIRVVPSRISNTFISGQHIKIDGSFNEFLDRLPCMKWAIYTCELLACGCMCVCNPSFAWELFNFDAWKESQKSCECLDCGANRSNFRHDKWGCMRAEKQNQSINHNHDHNLL